MVYYKNQNNILIYGGEDDKGITDENIYKLSLENKSWSIINLIGLNPGARTQHSMNFFKPNILIIFGGKVKKKINSEYLVTNDVFFINLDNNLCTTPFIAGIAPISRFGHCSSYNSTFVQEEHSILGGLDKTYCALDFYQIKETKVTINKKWVIEYKKMHNNLNEEKDEIYETAKKTIINFKKQLEILDYKYLDINKK